MKKLLIVAMLFLGTSVLASSPAFAQTDTDQRLASPAMCWSLPTVQSLRECVLHAREIGAIKSAGVTRSLLFELDVAQSALDRERPRAAIAWLHAFVREVDALAGKQIMQPHAGHLVMHARMVIRALGD